MLRFAYGPTGKPALDGEASASGISFNVSHSQTLALYAVARQREVGVDIEHIRQVKRFIQIAHRYFSPREYAALMSLPPHEQNVAFLNAWTRKEAFVKAYGTGIADTLDGVEVTLLPSEPAALLHVAGENAKHWGIVALAPAAGYVGALVAEGREWQVRQWGEIEG
jgi:4'-phosphopantetheinyl transferase